MRREIKYPFIGFSIFALGGGVFDIINQYLELGEENNSFRNNIDWHHVLKSAGKGGILGAVGGYLFYRLQISNESQLPYNADDYLHKVLFKNNIRNDQVLYTTALKQRDKIKNFLYDEFNGLMAEPPVNWGSISRGTAIGNNFDFDILVPFCAGSFASLAEMYNEVYKVLLSRFGSTKTDIRKQKRSLGITFYINSSELHFDVVPGREINNYRTDKVLNLYVRPDNFWNRPSRLKTNLDTHRALTVNRPEERKVVKLLKLYRDLNGLKIKSIVIQNIVMKAFEHRSPSYSLADNLIYVMEYIVGNISSQRIVDPGNSGNILSNSMNDYNRVKLINRLNRDLDRIVHNDRYFREI